MKILFWNAKGARVTQLEQLIKGVSAEFVVVLEPDGSVAGLGESGIGRASRSRFRTEPVARAVRDARSASPAPRDLSRSPLSIRRSGRQAGLSAGETATEFWSAYSTKRHICAGGRSIVTICQSGLCSFDPPYGSLAVNGDLGEHITGTLVYAGKSVNICIVHAPFDQGSLAAAAWMGSVFTECGNKSINLIIGDTNLANRDETKLDGTSRSKFVCKFAKATSVSGYWYDRIYVRKSDDNELADVSNCQRVMLGAHSFVDEAGGRGDDDFACPIDLGFAGSSNDHRPVIFDLN